MENQFKEPQRQSKIGILVMFADTIQKTARAFWPLLVVYLFKLESVNKLYIGLTAISVFAVMAIVAYLKYLNFRFYVDVDQEEFVVTNGVLNKTKTVIQLSKIQQVNITQNLLQRIINVYTLEANTAGASGSEVKIKALSHSAATLLKSQLLNFQSTKSEEGELHSDAISRQEHFMKIGFISLFKVGITSNYLKTISLLLAFGITIYDNILKFAENEVLDEEQIDNYLNQSIGFQLTMVLVAIGIFLILIINVVTIILKYFDFTIVKERNSLLLSYGLLKTKSTLLRPERVQIASISQNFFQLKMNLFQIKIRQALGGNAEHFKSILEIPGCNKTESQAIMKMLFDISEDHPLLIKANWRKLALTLFIFIGIPAILYVSTYLNTNENIDNFQIIIPLYIFTVLLISYFSFKNYQLEVGTETIIKQSGAWDVEKQRVSIEKIQAITTSQRFWHKSINIGSVTIHTAAGNISFKLGNFTTLQSCVNRWIYQIENSNSNWM